MFVVFCQFWIIAFNYEKEKTNFILLLKFLTLFIALLWRDAKQSHRHFELQTRTIIPSAHSKRNDENIKNHVIALLKIY
jgi:hypothetical protein